MGASSVNSHDRWYEETCARGAFCVDVVGYRSDGREDISANVIG